MMVIVATEKMVVELITADILTTLAAVKIGNNASHGPKTKIINTTQTVMFFIIIFMIKVFNSPSIFKGVKLLYLI